MRPAENIEKLIKNIKIDTNAEMDKAVLDDVLKALEKSKKTKSAIPQPNIWRKIMKNKITKLATAAVIIIAVLIGINHFGGSIGIASVAFADVLDAISKAKTLTYMKTTETEGRSYTTEVMISESGVMRMVLLHNLSTPKFSNNNDPNNINISIWDLGSGTWLQMSPSNKKARIIHRIGERREITLLNYAEWLSTLSDKSGVFAGQEEIDGQMTNKFICDRGEFTKITVWVDPVTNLPVRVEQVDMPHPKRDIALRLSLSVRDFGGNSNDQTTLGGGILEKQVQIMTDFVWNEELDESLFSVTPPQGYAVEEEYQDVSQPDERDLIKALAFWTEMSDGIFPTAINDLGDENDVKSMLVEKFHKGGDPKEEFDQALQMMHVILRGLLFTQEQKINGSWGYAGREVEFGDSGKPVCWWKVENSKSYRVIYGNLSIADSNAIPLVEE